ncbi:SGNH/GDSL hydrolase family protein [Agromyces sp. CCNWLW203]|uniref:SGNH/GDSL hydrolase family protein n=1 Tax=Agromyces sp. CCNWLW203 TaxID=3112842 RepID=UPI002F964F69
MSTSRLGHGRAAPIAAPFAVLMAVLLAPALSACSASPGSSSGSSPASTDAAPTASTTRGVSVILSPAQVAGGAEVLIIGDSYTEGYGITPGTDWAHLVVADRGWDATIDGISGTGFTQGAAADGRTGIDYASRLRSHADDDSSYDLVVLQGGLNDLFVPAAEQRDNVAAAVRAAHAAWPEAGVVVFGPIAPFGGFGDRDDAGIIRTAAGEAGALYIDPVSPSLWLDEANSPEFDLGDGLHVNEAGQEHLAERFVEALLDAVE